MITSESFTSDPDQVNHLIRWWVSQSKKRYHYVRLRGTVEDFVHDVWCALLANFRNDKAVEFTLATVIINHCSWVLFRHTYSSSCGRTRFGLQYGLRYARRIQSNDRVGNDEELIEYVHAREFDDALARIMRTLTFREAIIIRARYGLFGDPELTLEQVGAAMKLSRERIRQIEGKALKKIQHHSRATKLIPFLDVSLLKH